MASFVPVKLYNCLQTTINQVKADETMFVHGTSNNFTWFNYVWTDS